MLGIHTSMACISRRKLGIKVDCTKDFAFFKHVRHSTASISLSGLHINMKTVSYIFPNDCCWKPKLLKQNAQNNVTRVIKSTRWRNFRLTSKYAIHYLSC